MIYPNTHVFHKNTKPVRRGFGDTVEVRSTQDQKVASSNPLPSARGVKQGCRLCMHALKIMHGGRQITRTDTLSSAVGVELTATNTVVELSFGMDSECGSYVDATCTSV